jgi:hypothetical protein
MLGLASRIKKAANVRAPFKSWGLRGFTILIALWARPLVKAKSATSPTRRPELSDRDRFLRSFSFPIAGLCRKVKSLARVSSGLQRNGASSP